MTDHIVPLLAAVTIGQSPRPDLLEPLRVRLPGDVMVIEVGALDALTVDDLPRGPAASPLTTRMRDGRPVTVNEGFLAPLVQAAVLAVEARGATVTLLLCAGVFPDVRARGRLIRPFEAAVLALRRLGARRIGVVVPISSQEASAERKWRAARFEPAIRVGPPSMAEGWSGIDAVVLDFVGHPGGVVDALREGLAVPVLDLGEAGAAAAADRFR
jgi:hypothetical protein